LKHFYQTCGSLKKTGIHIKYITTLENFDKIEACHYKLCEVEMAVVHRDWFRKYSDLYSEDNRQAILRGQRGIRLPLKDAASSAKLSKTNCSVLQNSITLPSGLSKNGLPMGLQIIGRWMEDEGLFNLARHLTGLLKWPRV